MTEAKETPATRREVIATLAATGALAMAVAALLYAPQAQTPPQTFVLVHGAYEGGWIWRYVAERLRAKGHNVFTPTYTGLGERSHLMSGMITLDTHITDVANVIKWERLENVVLAGHSYGGWVISGVVERMLPKIASIVYVDAFLPESGQKGLDLSSPGSQKARARRDREGRGVAAAGLLARQLADDDAGRTASGWCRARRRSRSACRCNR